MLQNGPLIYTRASFGTNYIATVLWTLLVVVLVHQIIKNQPISETMKNFIKILSYCWATMNLASVIFGAISVVVNLR